MKMDGMNNIVCPVCTLYLRPGITLEHHLTSHPKQKVIEALIKLSQLGPQNIDKIIDNECLSTSNDTFSPVNNNVENFQNGWNQPTPISFGQLNPTVSQITSNVNQVTSNVNHIVPNVNPSLTQIPANQLPSPTNHSFIYQQFMSSSGTQPALSFNPMTQQFVAVPTVFNPQMFCSPYVFQQQQQLHIVSTGCIPKQSSEVSSSFPAISPATSVSVLPNTLNNVSLQTNGSVEIIEQVEKNEVNNKIEKDIEKHDDKNFSENDTRKPTNLSEEEEMRESDTNDAEQCSESYEDGAIDPLGTVEIIPISATSMDVVEIIPIHQKTDDRKSYIDNTDDRDPENEVEIMKINTKQAQDNEEDDQMILMENVQIERVELDKACQTNVIEEQQISIEENCTMKTEIIITDLQTECAQEEMRIICSEPSEINKKNFFMTEVNTKIINLPSNNNITMSNENITFLEIDPMNFILPHDLVQNGQSIISKVEDFECITDSSRERPQILMNIGLSKSNMELSSLDKKSSIEKLDESVSQHSLNIHADERMPPRGELSEQESNGASDIVWGGVYQEGSSGMSTSYDLIARESWEGSDCSDSEVPPLQSRVPPSTCYSPDLDTDAVITISKKAPLSFSCSTCGETFNCPKERRVHQSQTHSGSSNSGFSQTSSRSKIKSQKKIEVKEENNFEIFAKSEPKIETPEKTIEEPNIPEDSKIVIKEAVLCNVCGELLSSMRELAVHLKNIHKIWTGQRHQCKTCSEEFPSDLKYSEHLRVHPLECNMCAKVFYRRVNFQLHMKRHWGVKPHKCEICTKAFLTKQKLTEHLNVHSGNTPLKCNLCDETFRRHSNLVQHRNRHHFNIKKKVKDFVCHCGEVFHSVNKFTWHKETHDSKPKSCMFCQEKFVHMSSLTRHIRRAHNQRYVPEERRDIENVECHICKGVYLKSSLEMHLLTHSNSKQHSCLLCGKEFTTKWNLKLHKWTHASRTSKPFKCDLCNGAFIRHSDYVAHMNSHKRVRPYTCNYCGCKFIRKYNCQRHVREHEEGKSYTCSVCNKSFHRSYYLKEHMRVHSGARPFACHICGKTSTTKSNHNKHMKIHHAREPVSTEG